MIVFKMRQVLLILNVLYNLSNCFAQPSVLISYICC